MTPQKRKLILEGTLVIVLFVLIAVSFTVAWFTSDTNADVDEFVIEVKSSDNFQLSLDGVNFENSISINLDNKEVQIGEETYDSSVQLSDLASVLTTLTNDQGTATYNQLNILNPTKNDENGEPITQLSDGRTWDNAIKSKVVKSGDKYYLTTSSLNSLAQYLELDIWVRSDSNLSIYLGSDSSIYPVTEVDEETDYLPAMASMTVTDYPYNVDYYYDVSVGQRYALTYTDTTNNEVYYFKNNVIDDVDTPKFLLKTNIQQLEHPTTEIMEDYTFYYTADNTYIVRSKAENISLNISDTTTPLGQCEAFYGASFNPLFYIKLVSDGNYKSKVVYDSQRKIVEVSDYYTFFNNLGNNFIEFIKMYDLNSFNLSHTSNSFAKKIETYYYDEMGKTLIRIVDDNGTVKYYNGKNVEVSAPDKPYKVLTESYYGTEDTVKVDDVFTTKTTKYTFSKNLAAGAALVSFSEILTDDFTDSNNVTTTQEVEDLKVLWNPLPKFSLVTQGTTSKYVYDDERVETLSYYTYDKANNKYILNDWAADSSLVKVGDFATSATSVGSGEVPICETKVASGDKYAIKKMRIKIWLDGNDCMAVNSMLNSSSAGNGQIKMTINLVANINATFVTCEPYTMEIGSEQSIIPGQFLITASKSNGNSTTFDFSLSGTWVNTDGITISTARLEDVPGHNNQKKLIFYKFGSVSVYARDPDGRIGQINVAYDYAKLIKIYDPTKPNEYKVIAVDMYCDKPVEEITAEDYVTTGKWEISDKNIANTTVNADGSLTVKFTSGGEEVVSYSSEQIETMYYTKYLASNNIKINHTYVVEGGE